MNTIEAGQRVSRIAGFLALAAWHFTYGVAWWAWLIWIPVIGIGAFFVPYVYTSVAALVGAPREALRGSDDEPVE